MRILVLVALLVGGCANSPQELRQDKPDGVFTINARADKAVNCLIMQYQDIIGTPVNTYVTGNTTSITT